ncbi:MAG: MATE family efflux transporter [Catonella sp.]|uniref:MATE family efflux transporter n=1 Tax=Catonella sp. TaxID=2382125 RepID=UPI003F9FD783
MNIKENKMGTMPVKQLIINMSLPMIVSMLVQALYNVVDSIFVAKLSEDALTAVTLAFPMQNFMIALATGTGVGFNVLLSHGLGEKNFDKSNAAANNGIFLVLVNTIVFILLGAFVTVPFITSQTVNTSIQADGIIYLQIISFLAIGVFTQITMERLLQSTGRTMLSMISQLTGAIINIILDPIMIFGLLGLPRMGVAGAAIATVIGQFCGAFMGIFLNLKYNTEITISIKQIFKPSLDTIKSIYLIAIPSILMISIGSIMTYAMNLILIAFSTTAAAVFGVYFKLQSFFFMPVFGLSNGLIPVLSFNYGAKNKKRIDESLKFALSLAFGIMLIGTITFELIPTILLNMFNASDDMMNMGVIALRTIAIHFPLAAIGIVLSSIFQAFAQSIYSLIVSIMRQLVVLVPAAWLLSQTGNVSNVWWAFMIAEVVSLVTSFLFFNHVYTKSIRQLIKAN